MKNITLSTNYIKNNSITADKLQKTLLSGKTVICASRVTMRYQTSIVPRFALSWKLGTDSLEVFTAHRDMNMTEKYSFTFEAEALFPHDRKEKDARLKEFVSKVLATGYDIFYYATPDEIRAKDYSSGPLNHIDMTAEVKFLPEIKDDSLLETVSEEIEKLKARMEGSNDVFLFMQGMNSIYQNMLGFDLFDMDKFARSLYEEP